MRKRAESDSSARAKLSAGDGGPKLIPSRGAIQARRCLCRRPVFFFCFPLSRRK